jgi:CHAD domain-containing protein
MAFAIDPTQPPGQSLRQLARKLLSKVATRLQAEDAIATGFHGVRKTLKKLRSLLLLGSGSLPEPALKTAVRDLGSIGRELSGARDMAVISQTLAELDLQDAELRMQENWPIFQSPVVPAKEPNLRVLTRTLRRVSREIDELPLETLGSAEIARGFAQSYRRGRHAMQRIAACPNDDDEPMHDWRKAAQRHWRHLQLLQPLWPQAFAASESVADQLTDALGRYQDLSVLLDAVRALGDAMPHGQRDLLTARCAERQILLRSEAMPLGHLLFAERPKAVRERLLCIWQPAETLRKTEAMASRRDKPKKKITGAATKSLAASAGG